jgi:hypothetical protein
MYSSVFKSESDRIQYVNACAARDRAAERFDLEKVTYYDSVISAIQRRIRPRDANPAETQSNRD